MSTDKKTKKIATDDTDSVIEEVASQESELVETDEINKDETQAPTSSNQEKIESKDESDISPSSDDESVELKDEKSATAEIAESKDNANNADKPIEKVAESKNDPKEADEPIVSRFKLDKTSKQTGDRGWYVIHTYAGYEEQVGESLQQRIDTLKMHDKIFDVIVPKEKQIEIKNGKRKIIEKRIFPGYVIVDMIVTDYSWYIVRNTPNVTGFIGLGVRPTPMDQDEIDRIKKRMGVEEPKYKVDLREDDLVRINDGPLKGFEGKVTEVDEAKGVIKVSVSMFGRETPVNLDFLQVKKM